MNPTALPHEAPPKPPARLVLEEALAIVDGGRDKEYGRPEDCFADIAQMWTFWLREKLITIPTDATGPSRASVSPHDVAMMMVLLKVVRDKVSHKHDNAVDLAGYAALGDKLPR